MSKSIFSFFSGAGLLDLGFEQADFDIVFINEYKKSFLEAYKYARSSQNFNEPRYGSSCCDINDFLKHEKLKFLQESIKIERDLGNFVGIIGGPPCPDFSVGGKNKGREGGNGVLAQSFINVIISCHPDFFVFENVKGLVKTAKHRQYFDELKLQLIEAGFIIDTAVLNALCYGVPQDRERVIMVGIDRKYFCQYTNSESIKFNFPWEKHALFTVKDIKEINWPQRQVFKLDCRRNFPRKIDKKYYNLTVEAWFRNNHVDRHPNSIDTFKVKSGYSKISSIDEGDVSRKSFKRLHRWRYSPTAAYGNNEVHLHPYKIRRLSVAESMAIQSLPEWFCLPKTMTLTDKFKVIGNGVPILMAQAIATTLSDFIDKIVARRIDNE